MVEATADNIGDLAQGWLADFESALSNHDEALFAELCLPDSHWRDLVSFTWDTRQFWGREVVREAMFAHADIVGPTNLRLDPQRSAPRLVQTAIASTAEFFISYDTVPGTGSAFVRAIIEPGAKWAMRARLIGTTLTSLHAAPTTTVPRHGYEPIRPGETWRQHRDRITDYAERSPDVLVVGGGQSGLTMGARLEQHGISYAIVEKNRRPGDTWRERYSSLALHTPTCVNNLPYVKMPIGFPTFMSKDQWADWLDAYAAFMDLSYWSSTTFVEGSFDEQQRAWTVTLEAADGSTRTVRPKHIVLALGYTGTAPIIPDIPGLAEFTGEQVHSSQFSTGENYAGKRVLVIGTSTSANDIALDLYHNGATVAMLQRGPACIVPISEAERYNVDYLNPLWSEDEVDQRRNSGFINPLLIEIAKIETERSEREFADMFDGLRKAGMTLTIGEDKTGWLMKLHRTFNGYYLDVGAAQVVADGGIEIIQLADTERFEASGLVLADGSRRGFDAVVYATGYRNTRTLVEKLFGPEVADKVGDVGGIGQDGEHRNMIRPTGQAHLWLIFGGIMDARKSSDILALQIIAQLTGVAPSLVRGPDGLVHPLDDSPTPVGSPS